MQIGLSATRKNSICIEKEEAGMALYMLYDET